MLISAIEMWTKFKNKLLKSKSRRLMKTGPPSTTNEWDEVFRPEVRSNKDERSTRSTMERNRRKSTRNGFFFSFGRFRLKKEESSAGSGNVDRKKITGNDVTVVSGDTPPKTGSRPVRPQLKDRKPDGSGNGNGNGEDGGGDDDRVTSAEVESLETSPRETGSSPVATDLPSFADYPVWIHRVWDEDGDDEGRESTPTAGDPQPSNGVMMSTFLGRSGGHDPLTANCAATVRASPPRLKRRKKPVPAPSSTDKSESRGTPRPGEGPAATSGTPEVQVPSPRVVAPPRVPNRGGGGGARDEFSVRLERSLDGLTSAGNGNEEEEEEEEGGRLKTVEGGFEWGRFYAPEPNSAAGLTLEKHSPDLTSSDDSTEGKESGYVTLEDLQAQLAGGSSSSSSSSSCSSSWSNNVVDGERSRIKIPFQSTQPSSTVRSLDAVPAPHRPTPASSSPSSAHHSATWCGLSADDDDNDGGGGGGKMTPDDVIASSFLKFTFTVKLESEMFRRRTSEREDHHRNNGVKYRCTGPKGRELVGAGGHRGDLAAAAGDQDPNRAEERKELYTGSCSFPQNRNKNVCSDDAVPVDTSSPKPFACSACSQAVGEVSRIATMTSDDVDENVAMTTPSSFPVARLRDVNRTAFAEARKFPRKQQTGRLPLSELHDNGMWRQPEPEMDCFDDDDDGFYLRPLSTTKRNIIADNNNTYRVTETPKCRGKIDEEEKKKKKKRGNLDEEVTHMTWDEVLVEAKSLGIHLQPPSKSPSGFSTTRNLDSSGAVLGTRTGSESATSGGSRFRSRKTGSSKSIRDLFRIQNVFTSFSSSPGGSNKENRRRDYVTVTGSRSTGRRIRSSCSPPPPPPPEDVGSIQRRRLPPPPPSPDMEEEEDERWFSRRTSVSTQACHCGSSRSRDCYLDDGGGVGVGVGVGGGWGSIGSWWGGGGCRGCAEEEEEEEERRRMCVCSSSVSVSSMGSRCSSVATATPVIVPSDGHRTPDSGLISSFRRQRRNQNGLLGTCLEQLQNCSWYWGSLSFEEAEERLANRPDGTFLVRDSSDERYLLSLSFTSLHSTHHTRIEHYKGMFSFYSQPMTSNRSATSIVEFIDDAVFASRGGHCLYYLRPRGPGQPPTPVRLLHPLSRFRYMHSLQHLSKFAVLRHVRRDLVDRLPLSPRLKEYLKSIH